MGNSSQSGATSHSEKAEVDSKKTTEIHENILRLLSDVIKSAEIDI
jgi:hypothetical protein